MPGTRNVHRWGWTQSICAGCFNKRWPGREPVTTRDRQWQQCCDCGKGQADGIYIREDPMTVRYPTPTDRVFGEDT